MGQHHTQAKQKRKTLAICVIIRQKFAKTAAS
jgi:hypothetical protein